MNSLRKTRIKWIIFFAAVILVIFIGAGAALSYISAESEPVRNDLVAGKVSCEVVEVFDGSVKTDVAVKNTGNTSAYIRCDVIANWQSKTNSEEILARAPVEGVDFEIVAGSSVWVEGQDGYWYHSEPIEPDEMTEIFIEKISPVTEAPEGYELSVEIIASAIQANPASVVETSWNVSAAGTTITPN